MIALEISLNGHVIAIAGAEDQLVLNAIIGVVRSKDNSEDFHSHVGGLIEDNQSDDPKHFSYPIPKPKLGDEFRIRVVNVEPSELSPPETA